MHHLTRLVKEFFQLIGGWSLGALLMRSHKMTFTDFSLNVGCDIGTCFPNYYAFWIYKLEAAHQKLEEATKEQEALIEIFSDERGWRDKEEENLRKKLKVRRAFSELQLLSYFSNVPFCCMSVLRTFCSILNIAILHVKHSTSLLKFWYFNCLLFGRTLL